MKMYKPIILTVVLYECETRSATLREEYRLRVLGNRMLQGIFDEKDSDRRLRKTA
jgi:hypothetical protein